MNARDFSLIGFQDAIIREWNDVHDRLPVRYFNFLRRRSVKTLVKLGYAEGAALAAVQDAFDVAGLARFAEGRPTG